MTRHIKSLPGQETFIEGVLTAKNSLGNYCGMRGKDDRNAYCPSEEEIRREMDAIRAGWSKVEESRRRVCPVQHWTPDVRGEREVLGGAWDGGNEG